MDWFRFVRDLIALFRRFSDWWLARQARQAGRDARELEDRRREDARVLAADRAAGSVSRDRLYDDERDFRD